MEPADETSTTSRSSATPRKPWRRWALACVLVWALVALAYLIGAGLDLQQGRRAAQDARDHRTSEVVEGEPIAELVDAREHFSRAHRRLSAAPLAPLRALPVIGRQLRSLRTLADSAALVSSTGASSLRRAVDILGRERAAADRPSLARQLSAVANASLRELADVDLGPEKGLLGPVASARDDFADDLAKLRVALRRGAAGARATATLLTGPRRYLVVAANNTEMRAGSGMFLSLGVLETTAGSLRLVDMQSVATVHVPPGVVPLVGDLRDRWGWLEPNREWRNLMLSPRFDVQAPLAAQMWQASGHPPVDGVLALDPVALQGLMRATGPVEVDGRSVRPSDLVRELLHDQYLRFGSDDDEIAARRDELGRFARATFEALDTGAWSVADLASGLLPVLDGRHLLAWSARPSDQRDWTTAEIDGRMRPESLLVAVSSRSGNKLDQFVHVSSSLDIAAQGDDTAVTVRVRIANRAPTGELKIVTGATEGSGVGEGVYSAIVAVTMPGRAREGRIEGVERLVVAGPDGPTRVVGTEVVLERGRTRTLVVRFRLPGPQGRIRIEPSARIPNIEWESEGETWRDTRPHRLFWRE